MRPRSRAPGQAEQRVDRPGGDAHRAHEDQLAADPQAQPRLDLVPGVARPGAPVDRQEGEGVALQPSVLDQPEEDDDEQRHEHAAASAAAVPTSTTSVGARRRRGLEDVRGRIDEGGDRARQGRRAEVRGPFLACSKKGGRAGDDLLGLVDGRRQDDEREPEHRRRRTWRRRSGSSRPGRSGGAAEPADHRLERRGKEDRDEQQEQDTRGGDAQGDEAETRRAPRARPMPRMVQWLMSERM